MPPPKGSSSRSKSDGDQIDGRSLRLKISQLRGLNLPSADSKYYAELVVDVNDLERETVDALETKGDLLARITSQTMECYYFIVAYWKPTGILNRAGQNLLKPTANTVIEFEANLRSLKDEFYGIIATSTHVTVAHILNQIMEIHQEHNLDDISYARGVRFDDSRLCLPGTRMDILRDIADWVHVENEERVLWLTGGLGTGKSSIAHTIAYRFHFLQRLGSSFFFVRGQADHDPDMLFSTIARDLADMNAGFREKLWDAIRLDRSLRTTTNVFVQFENFLVKPSAYLTLTGPIVVVIDALDECGDVKSRRALLEVLSTRVKDLPLNIRIIVTSRAEADIEASLSRSHYVHVKRMDDIPASSTEHDIRTYLTQRLARFPVDFNLLTDKCEGNFQWAFVASEYITEDQPGFTWEERYQTVIGSNNLGNAGPLDFLYEQVLEQLFSPMSNPIVLARFRLVMAILLSALVPLSAQSINVILSHLPAQFSLHPDLPKPFDSYTIVKFMGSLLSGVTDKCTPIRARHASFKEFLTGTSTSPTHRFIVDLTTLHDTFSLACLRIMERELRFNICSLESSYLLNKHIPDLPARTERAIPHHLSYACLFWAEHLQRSSSDEITYDEVLKFLHHRLLFWLEIISLSGAVSRLPEAVANILSWSNSASRDENPVGDFANDLQRYLSAYGVVITHSVPHIYLSVPFIPSHSAISQHYLPMVRRSLQVVSCRTVEWPLVESILRGHTELVLAVSVSPNSSRVASCSADGTVRYWDAATGNLVGEPLRGHGDEPVNDVAFSPCGKLIASAGGDGTVRFWDTSTCREVGEPLMGHTGPVLSVVFHQDGKTIATGSYDETIRLWDEKTRLPILPPLRGHTMAVTTLAFSPDGSYLVSGSYDATVRFWKTSTGETMREPLLAHSLPITCVRLSSDSNHMATTSYEDKLRLWDTATWACVGEPMRGYDDFAMAAAFSPDGKQVATNAYHEAFVVFDTTTSLQIGQPLRGHEGCVLSIAFSPDNSRIVTCSDDTTVRLWQPVKTGSSGNITDVAGHTGSVNCLAFSADGSRIVSGSFDETVRIWDTATGTQFGPPLRGHTKPIMSVAYSPDDTHVASASYDNSIRLWRLGTASATLDKVIRGHDGGVNCVCFSTSSTRLISGSDDLTVRIWDAQTGKPVMRPLRGHTKSISSVAVSPDGVLIASASHDFTIRFWDAETGASAGESLSGESACTWLSFSADGGRLAAGYQDGGVRIWDVRARTMVGVPLHPHTRGICSVALSPDGGRVASSAWDQTVRITALDESESDIQLDGHRASVFALAFAPDGRTLGTASYDHTIRLWNTDVCADDTPPPIMLSSNAAHALADADDLFPDTVKLNANDRRDCIRLQVDGWVVGPRNALLFWIPPEHRARMWTPRTQRVLGYETTQIDLSAFAHGLKWHQCFSGAS
ncbi:WD40-repeat-containing domain protein [Vararia minispora EC-137]|uniref:WD40-repeat-containing domain protein n=1 Tax=Vararia minispora EC-137 TaxID=1314806 RepID=A0ACB8QCB7_9AGAM|nr:WD40-repeat-containing domain protein [Vararia minispora EC-137]